ncbi:MAG TPA: SH3 domain-containing protein [Dokdonella sp.]
MKRCTPILAGLCVAAFAASHAAAAAEAYLVDTADLYAGPDVDYPQITSVPGGAPVEVYGCTSGWEWCDVQAGPDRGWVGGDYLQYQYQDRWVVVPTYGARIGIPIVAFALGTYWDAHYRSRPWYGRREEWAHRGPPHRPPPRPHAHVQPHVEQAGHPPRNAPAGREAGGRGVDVRTSGAETPLRHVRTQTPPTRANPPRRSAPASNAPNTANAAAPDARERAPARAAAAHPGAPQTGARPARAAEPAKAASPRPAPGAKPADGGQKRERNDQHERNNDGGHP